MAGGRGIIQGTGLRQYVRPTSVRDLQDYVHRLAKNSLQMDSDGNVDIIGVINVGLAGGFFQGTGTFASPTTGLKIYNSNGNGVIELWDASAKAFSLTHTKLLFGSNVTAAATTAFVVLAEDATYNSESLGAGDVLLGDNSSNKANLLWDKSAGKLQLRGGTTMQCEIGTDGKLYAGGGKLWLDSTGMRLRMGALNANSILWLDDNGYASATLRASRSGTLNSMVVTLDIIAVNDANDLIVGCNGSSTSYEALQEHYVLDGTASSSYVRTIINTTEEFRVSPSAVKVVNGLNVGSATGAGTGSIAAAGTRPELSLLTSGTAKAHFAQYAATGAYVTYNLTYDGANWNLDDTSAVGAVLDANVNAAFRVRAATAGTNPRTLSLLFSIDHSGKAILDQLTNDGNILELRSTDDVQHGITDIANTNAFSTVLKASAGSGGAAYRGLTEATVAFMIQGYGVTDNTTHDATGRAYVEVEAYKKSGTGTTTPGTDANLFAVKSGTSTKFIVDAEGDLHYDGTTNVYDEHDDALAVRDLTYCLSRDPKHREWITRYGPEHLTAMGVLQAGPDGRYFESHKNSQALIRGAIGQQYEAIKQLERKIRELEQLVKLK